MCEKCFYFLLNSSFSRKMVFLRKLKLIYPSTPQHYINCSAPIFEILFKKFLDPSPLKKENRGYAFYVRDYKWETIKLLPFYMKDFLFTELKSHNIWRKLKDRMKNDIPNIPSHLHISDPNFLQYEFHHIVIKFITRFPWYFKIFSFLWLCSSRSS